MRDITGIVGEIILHVLTGLFGFVAYIMPPLVLHTAFYIYSTRKGRG